MKSIGLTGGIGSGKSTLAGMLAGLGVPVLDLDAVGRVLHRDADCLQELLRAFGKGILDEAGVLDRRALAALCFADAKKTQTLNAIMHPRIRQAEQVWLAGQQAAYVLIEASVLIESGGAARMDAVVVVLADEAVRRQRVLTSRGMDQAGFDAVLARQCCDAERRKAADFVIENNADLAALHQSAASLHRQLLALSGS
ncbi:MAG: dephospho-CoA kinase [Mariprofundaceae bacterium]|nr:dephospho-CoA kinase [Mariprofundaceae bacterium]